MDTIEKAREICRKLKLPEDGPAHVIIADELEYLDQQLQAAESEAGVGRLFAIDLKVIGNVLSIEWNSEQDSQKIKDAIKALQTAEQRANAAEQELVIAFGTIRQLQAQLANTPEEQREMAESAWLAGMDDTWYAKLQAAEQRAAEAEHTARMLKGEDDARDPFEDATDEDIPF